MPSELNALVMALPKVLELTHSLFGSEATNVERFTGWLHRQTASSPLFFLELVRQLSAVELLRTRRVSSG